MGEGDGRGRSWHCLFGNSRPPGPRGMLMRERPFSRGVGVGAAKWEGLELE